MPDSEAGRERIRAAVLTNIREAQEAETDGYRQAFHEIKQQGRKTSCWMWYIWPCLAYVRKASRPEYSLPDLKTAEAYLFDPVLAPRLLKITAEAVKHLKSGVPPDTLFGGHDKVKFIETMTFFGIAATEAGDFAFANVFIAGLHARGWKLDQNTIRCIVQEEGLARYAQLSTPDDLKAMQQLATVPAEVQQNPKADILAPAADTSEEQTCTAVLNAIRRAQEQYMDGYRQALSEIKWGRKTSHWIWYVWPCLGYVRKTSRPEFSLPDLETAKAYLLDPVLAPRLCEITHAAIEHLEKGVQAKELFGSSVDRDKFVETMTFFAVAATEARDLASAKVFIKGLRVGGWKLDEKTLKCIADQEGLAVYMRVSAPEDLMALQTHSTAPAESQKPPDIYGIHTTAAYTSEAVESSCLQNLGNTCYLNAVMQSLSSLREFVRDLRAMPDKVPTCSSGELFRCTVDILEQMSTESVAQGPLSPSGLRNRIAAASPVFGGSEQQDAHEFFLEYLNQLHDCLLAARTAWLGGPGHEAREDDSVLATRRHLGFEVSKRLACASCGKHRDVNETFYDLSLDFGVGDGKEGRDSCAVADMLGSYFAPETVEAKCGHCAAPMAYMEKTLGVPPRTLVLHLKRFVRRGQRYEKQHQDVDMPSSFGLHESIGVASTGSTLDCRYGLRSVISHEGETPHSGHYVCYARGEGGTWRLYNDSTVRDLGADFGGLRRELARKAYILIYVLEAPHDSEQGAFNRGGFPGAGEHGEGGEKEGSSAATPGANLQDDEEEAFCEYRCQGCIRPFRHRGFCRDINGDPVIVD